MKFLCLFLIPNSVEQISSWEANGTPTSQQISRILWSLKFHYRFHKSQPLVRFLSHMNLVYTFPPHTHRSSRNIRFNMFAYYVVKVVAFLQDFHEKSAVHLCSFPIVPHSPPPTRLAMIWSPHWYLVRIVNYEPCRCVMCVVHVRKDLWNNGMVVTSCARCWPSGKVLRRCETVDCGQYVRALGRGWAGIAVLQRLRPDSPLTAKAKWTSFIYSYKVAVLKAILFLFQRMSWSKHNKW